MAPSTEYTDADIAEAEAAYEAFLASQGSSTPAPEPEVEEPSLGSPTQIVPPPATILSTLNKGANFAADTIGAGINKTVDTAVGAGKGFYKFAEEAAKEAGPLPDTGNILADTVHSIRSTFRGMDAAVAKKWDAMTPSEQGALVTRTIPVAAAAAATGGYSLSIQALATTIAGAIGGETSEALGFEEDTPLLTPEKLKEHGSNLVAGWLLPKMMETGGKALGAVGENISQSLKKKEMAQPGFITAQSGIGKNTGGEMNLVKDLKAGEETFAKVVTKEFPKTIKNPDELKVALQDSLDKRIALKKEALNEINAGLKGKAPFSRKDAGSGDLRKEIRKLEATGLGKEMANELKSFQKELTDTFTTPKPQGQTGTMPKPKNFTEMQELLDVTYKRLRRLKAFDDNFQAQGGLNPSVLEANKDAIDALTIISDKIKTSMHNQAVKLEGKGIPIGTAKKLQLANKEIHELIPFEDFADRFSMSGYQKMKSPPSGSLMKAVSEGGLVSKATNIVSSPLTNPIVETARRAESVNFGPKTYQDIQQASRIRTGAESVKPGLLRQSMGAPFEAAGETLNTLAGAAPAAVNINPPVPILNQMKEDPRSDSNLVYDEILKDPMSVEMLLGDPDLDPATVESFIKSKNFTDLEKNTALGKLKMEAAAYDKGWFPPSPMKGINSYIALPKAEYRGSKVLGVVTDPNERRAVLDAINAIPDVEKRTKMKSAFNDPNNLGYLIDFPGGIKAIPIKEPKPNMQTKDVIKTENSAPAKIETGTVAGEMDRTVYDY